jgi:hypothetical protein
VRQDGVAIIRGGSGRHGRSRLGVRHQITGERGRVGTGGEVDGPSRRARDPDGEACGVRTLAVALADEQQPVVDLDGARDAHALAGHAHGLELADRSRRRPAEQPGDQL